MSNGETDMGRARGRVRFYGAQTAPNENKITSPCIRNLGYVFSPREDRMSAPPKHPTLGEKGSQRKVEMTIN